jgi:GAF domain-containing protein
VRKVDELQYEFRQGPCVDAVQGRRQAGADDLRVDVRWPKYGPVAADLGIVSQMGIELFDEPGLIAGLNLYSSTVGAFDDDAVEAAMLFAIQATHTLGRVMAQEQLTDAMTASTTIGRACGVVMQRFRLGADRAFKLLTRASRIHDLTLEVLAEQILDEVTKPPKPAAADGRLNRSRYCPKQAEGLRRVWPGEKIHLGWVGGSARVLETGFPQKALTEGGQPLLCRP